MRIGIIGPSEDEIMPFIEEIWNREIKKKAMLNFYSGEYEGIEVVSLFCGVCKVNAAIATQILIDDFNVSHVIVVGVSGAMKMELNIGDTVIGAEMQYHDVVEDILIEYHPWMENEYFEGDEYLVSKLKEVQKNDKSKNKIYFGKIVTGESFISEEGRSEINYKYNPLCVDMETASIAHVCYVNNIPVVAIRSITDTEEECGIENFENNCVDASNRSISILKELLKLVGKE